MKLYGRTTSFNVQKVLWLLEELQLSFEHIEVGGRHGGLNDKNFVQLNPMRKVPVLVDGDNVVWESHTILRYLASEYGSAQWQIHDAYQRTLYERWMDWSQVIFQPAFMTTFWGYYRQPPAQRDMEEVNRALDICHDCLETLSEQLTKTPYLAGSQLSLADIVVGAALYRLTEQGLDVRLPESVSVWYSHLRVRDGYQKWIMSDFTELKGRTDY
ncbi:glutathione S-transferase [Veronia nyctiphanis]|uniref:Glutathione S-transferase n=1 Tax=Veronia nyctiphanis TaxID=1278244 RepID=A0A4Q0YP67_9GAMM|nr:glutathione S-transferase family protein [Veronia nyctiphanis]RXJ72732.1 glutathione S-transferase [Veronia nyctiphanis]